ncbi:MAG: hypothetical protein ACI9CV_000965, partial [Ilumatobacter sp.]
VNSPTTPQLFRDLFAHTLRKEVTQTAALDVMQRPR